MNRGISYLWKNNLLSFKKANTVSGKEIEVIDCGTNRNKSNVFHEAKVKIGERIWAGDVVLHEKSSDWEDDIRKNRGIYDNVILHITMQNDCDALRRHGEPVEQIEIKCPPSLEKEMHETFDEHCRRLQCSEAISNLEEIKLHGILSRLLVERIEEKATLIEELLTSCEERWDETLFKTMVRSFGFGIQSSEFEDYASILNFQALGKHSDNMTQIEAIFFGQAGLLEEESIPYYYLENAKNSTYYNELKREYRFLSNKFGLTAIDHKKWNCGNTTPHLRIARIAVLYQMNRLTVSGITAADTLNDIYRLFSHTLNGYWQNHTCFGGTETTGNGCMKLRQVDVIIINSVAPMLYIYGKHRKEERLCGMAEDLLHRIEPEENSIIKKWREQGVKAECAADSQALLHLSRSYCPLCLSR